ncbi:MAG: GH25 family lysozyme [Eubacterium sp.]
MKKTRENIFAFIIVFGIVFLCASGFAKDVSAATVKQNIKITKIYSTVSGNKIKWTNSYSVSGYEIYRSINGGKYLKYDVTTSEKYTDTDIETGEKYSYKIRAFKQRKGKKKYSKISIQSDSLEAKPYGVSDISASCFSDYNLISWKSEGFASGYKIYRSDDNAHWEILDNINAASNIYEDHNIDSSKEYSYKISAFEVVNGKAYESVISSPVKSNQSKGIDVSYHNGKIDWEKVRNAGISFAMIRLGYGTSKGGVVDNKLDYNYTQAKKYGIKIGFYFYSYADNLKEAKKEAKFTVNLLEKYKDAEYPVAFDFENAYRNKKKYKKSNTKIITKYCDYLESKGYNTCVYSYLDFLKKSVNCKKISKYGIWLAKWTYNANNFSDGGISNVQIWQYSDKGTIKGISGNVDLNINIDV